MIYKKINFLLFLVLIISYFGIQQHVFADTQTNFVAKTTSAPEPDLSINFEPYTTPNSIHLAYRAIRVANVSYDDIKITKITIDNAVGNDKVMYCDPDNTFGANDPRNCAFNGPTNPNDPNNVCKPGSILHATSDVRSCLIWFKSVRNNDIVFGKFSGTIHLTVNGEKASQRGVVPVTADKTFSANYEQDLYAAIFVSNDYEESGGLYKWDGSAWSATIPLAQDYFYVQSLATMKGDLYIGGQFDTSPIKNLANVNHIMEWNGSSWANVGGGVKGDESRVFAMAAYHNELYVGGRFSHAGNVEANNIAKWNGSEWSSINLPNGAVYGIASTSNELYVQHNVVSRWNGSKWDEILDANDSDHREAFSTIKNELYIADLHDYIYTAKKWDGSKWTTFGTTVSAGSRIEDFAEMNGEIYVAGTFDKMEGALTPGDNTQVHGIAKWNWSDAKWEALGTNEDYFLSLENTSHDLYAGRCGHMCMLQEGGVKKWDGSKWSCVGSDDVLKTGSVEKLLIVPSLTMKYAN